MVAVSKGEGLGTSNTVGQLGDSETLEGRLYL